MTDRVAAAELDRLRLLKARVHGSDHKDFCTAPIHLSNEEAHAWASGWDACIAWLREPTDGWTFP